MKSVIFRKIGFYILDQIGRLLGNLVPKQGNLVILQGISRTRYNESPRYLYEYLSNQKDLNVFWITNDKKTHLYLKSKGFKSLYGKIDKFRYMLRAKLVISAGSVPINFFNTIGHKTIKYCTMHGLGPKFSFYIFNSFEETLVLLRNVNQFDYVNFTSRYTANLIGKMGCKLPPKKIVILGYPKVDHFFNKEKMDKCLKEKTWCKTVFKNLDAASRIILYAPTWRKNGSGRIPLLQLDGFQAEDFSDFLMKNNLFLIYSIHPLEEIRPELKSQNIFYLDYNYYKMADLNSIMPEVDLLLNDYSSTSTEFAILDRPQLFVMPDYDEYLKNDCFIENYRAILPGKEVFSYSDLKSSIMHQLNRPLEYNEERKKFLEKYYDLSLCDSCLLHYQFIKNLLNIS